MELEKLKDIQFVFIIGMGRSGSSLLSHAFSTHPEVAGIGHELTVFTNYIAPLVNSYEKELEPINKGKWKQGLPLLWDREKLDAFVLGFIEKIYLSLDIHPSHKVILDKYPPYTHNIELIHYYLPKAKFIHLIRDGRDVAYSWNKVWSVTGFGNPHFAGACIDWIQYKNKAKKAKQYIGNYYEVRYEDLLLNPAKELTGLFTFCNLDASPELVESIVQQSTGEKNMVSFPDRKVSYSERVSGKALWKMRLSKYETYIAKRYLKKELIIEGYEKDEKWGLNPLETVAYSIVFFIKRAYFKLLRETDSLIKSLLSKFRL